FGNYRWFICGRGGFSDAAGCLIQNNRQTYFPHGAFAPSLRTKGCARINHRGALLGDCVLPGAHWFGKLQVALRQWCRHLPFLKNMSSFWGWAARVWRQPITAAIKGPMFFVGTMMKPVVPQRKVSPLLIRKNW